MKLNLINYWTAEHFKDKCFVLLNISGMKAGIDIPSQNNRIIDIVFFNIGVEIMW